MNPVINSENETITIVGIDDEILSSDSIIFPIEQQQNDERELLTKQRNDNDNDDDDTTATATSCSSSSDDENNNSTRSIMPQENKEQRSKPCVSFSEEYENETYYFTSIPHYFTHEYYYSQCELFTMKAERRNIAKKIRKRMRVSIDVSINNNAIESNEGYSEEELTCTRGLENLLDGEFNRQRISIKRTTVSAVLKEQERQRCTGIQFDPEAISKIYRDTYVVSNCEQNAHERGIEDYNECLQMIKQEQEQRTLEENSDNNAENTSSSSTDIVKDTCCDNKKSKNKKKRLTIRKSLTNKKMILVQKLSTKIAACRTRKNQFSAATHCLQKTRITI